MKPSHDPDHDSARITPGRAADAIHAAALRVYAVQAELQKLRPFFSGGTELDYERSVLADVSERLVDLATLVRIGRLAISAERLDRPVERPILEAIERNRKPLFGGIESNRNGAAAPIDPAGRRIEDLDVAVATPRPASDPIVEGVMEGARNGFAELTAEPAPEAKRRRGRPRKAAALEPTPPPAELNPDEPLTGASSIRELNLPGEVLDRIAQATDVATIAELGDALADVIDDEDEEKRFTRRCGLSPNEFRMVVAAVDLVFPIDWTRTPPTLQPLTGADIFPDKAASEKRARKREADRKYAEKKRAARLVAKAIGNPVESAGEPIPAAVREPVIDGPTAPAESFADPPDDIDTLDLAFTTCADLRAKGLTTVEQVAAALEEEFALMGLTEAQIIAIEKAIAKARPKPKRSKPAPEPDPLADLFVCWGRGKVGRHANPVYGIRAPSLAAAIAFAKSKHPKDADLLIKPDLDGTIGLRKLPVHDAATGRFTVTPPELVDRPRTWEAFDLRAKPPTKLGEVTGLNSTRAIMEAEAKWPDVPKRSIEIREKGARRRPANRLQPTAPDRDLAEFRAAFGADDPRAIAAVERRAPTADPVGEEVEA